VRPGPGPSQPVSSASWPALWGIGRRAKSGCAANLRSAGELAKEIHQSGTWSCSNLIQEGTIGLRARPLRSSTPPAAYKFVHLRLRWIRQGSPGRLPEEPPTSARSTSTERVNKLKKGQRELEARKLGRTPSLTELGGGGGAAAKRK